MASRELERIRSAILDQRYALSEHAYDEMAEDNLDVLDVESAVAVLTVSKRTNAMYDFSCEHCDGIVRERRVAQEALRHKGGFVILEDVPVGVCEKCGARYFDASVLRRVAEIGRGTVATPRTIEVPVERYLSA